MFLRHTFMHRSLTRRLIGIFLCVLAVIGTPGILFAQQAGEVQTTGAVLSFSPPSGTMGVGKTLTVTVAVESPAPFNSANAVINFDKNILSFESVSKASSAFSFWPEEPTIANAEGKLSFGGGGTIGLTGKKTILTITLKGVKEGKSDVTFTTGSVLAADGKGTDILSTKSIATYTVSASAPSNTPPPPAPSGGDVGSLGPKPEAPDVTSTSHPDEALYYNAPKARFLWELPPDVMVVRMDLDKSAKTDPKTSYDPAINEKEFDQLTDGVMYFHLKYQNEGGWGPVTHKKIMVDKTPPPEFTLDITVPASSTDVKMKFSATDTMSGIDRYEVVIDAGNPIKILLAEIKDGEYTLANQTPGEHSATLKAYDKAGNYTPVDGKFMIEGEVPSATAKAAVDDTPKPTDWSLIANIFLIALVAFLIGYLWYERKAFRKEKYLTKREADELRDSLGNIFAALREEIGEQAGALFQKPNPSAQDREVMENINEAIDLSEELISKEAEDVRKLLM
ncbi:MAG: hypothetical protein A2845_05010 [Candidatus Lloydbacteria bacterium RIFCSPHIGHO2_01_FULL_49_22]|uniref:Cohesin domain-containing protein n=1 Tax=Candidatus Lloydbacteria bacterium RIFCSPHIGHO2_01_FULL_49_22 TaxID=1798658 RepID=A0A1G2CUB2_9BACT|nr:MAG: hypothetical protein A2845_05010 [Candidatus Lloydbacteria bacterium RIFCSPHIGHO2_01_FULL_49_22]OGZ09487.1 MAG: hypothetical protein A3C14_01565 [Candidatus Lloydbacteria bacterium RIFCSPHIGHO2_02_FULL_50_18]